MRGKQGAESARRKAEMAMEHIDRLTEQLADEKVRRKQVEAAAARVPGLERQNRELLRMVEERTGPDLERERTSRATERARHEDHLNRLAEVIHRLSVKIEESGDVMSVADHETIDNVLGDRYTNLTGMSRSERRSRLLSGGKSMSRISDQDLKEAGLLRVGDHFKPIPPKASGGSG